MFQPKVEEENIIITYIKLSVQGFIIMPSISFTFMWANSRNNVFDILYGQLVPWMKVFTVDFKTLNCEGNISSITLIKILTEEDVQNMLRKWLKLKLS